MLDSDLGNIGAILSKFADAVKMCLIAMFKNYVEPPNIWTCYTNALSLHWHTFIIVLIEVTGDLR